MAQMFTADDIDFEAYAIQSEAKMKVRSAGNFAADLDAEFVDRTRTRHSRMQSTKLAEAIQFRPAEVSIWAGYNGHRKSMFLGQLVLDFCELDERSLIVSLEMTPGKTLARMCRQAAATNWPGTKDRERFIRWTDPRLWIFDHIGRLQPSQALAVCRYFAQELQGRHVVIDSMMKVCQSEESLDEQKQMVSDLCDVAKETGLHVHLVAHCKKPSGSDEDKPPTKYDIRGSASISDMAHNVLLVWQNKARRAEADKPTPDEKVMSKPDAIVAIDKQRNGDVEGKFAFWFDEKSLRFCDDRVSVVEPYVMQEA